MFAGWGRFVYHRRWWVLALSLLLLGVVAGVGFGFKGQLNNSSSVHYESIQANDLLTAELPKVQGAGGATFEIVFASTSMHVSDPAYRAAVEKTLAPLAADSHVATIVTPYTTSGAAAQALESRDGKEALAVITLKDAFQTARGYFPALRSTIHSDQLQTFVTGNVAISADFDTYLARDLNRAELSSIPTSLILLLVVFATLIAALLPIGVGGAAVVAGVAATLLLARFTDVSTYALNIVTLIGLGVAIDYSLLIVNRFKEELQGGADVEHAVERSMATAGRAVTFSGLTVAIGLAGMLFFPGTFLVSMGVAGSIVVALAVVFALTLLPALLSLSGHSVLRLRIPFFGTRSASTFWQTAAGWVMRRPVPVLLASLVFVGLTAWPVLSIRIANGDEHMLPPQAQSVVGVDRLAADFPGQDQNTIIAVVHYPSGPVLTSQRIGELYDYAQQLKALPDVIGVDSVVTFNPSLGRQQYQDLLTTTPSPLPAAVQQQLSQTYGKDIAVFSIRTDKPAQSDAAVSLLNRIRTGAHPAGATLLVTGNTAFNQDFIHLILADAPGAVIFVILVTYVVLFLLVGSVLLPLKAVLTNLLSLSASFGLIVFIFQEGHLASLLNFTPQSIDPTLPVLMFCIVFGLSMDYEVMLLTRIQEVYKRTGDNLVAVTEGLARSGRIITGAAGIMVVVFLSFGLAQVLLIKAIGIGLAVAVVIDATVMRMLIVPAVMRLLQDVNWWAPGPLRRLHDALGLGEGAAPPSRPETGEAA
ncbi:MAG TPA: MMPL family transporter [Candidatus Dormibacteraeota bacterium]|nr:MMPL family transporter [Candidatus Dormibacteraeota bacterium]